MTTHVNFYENLKEAQFRLRGTVVLYDGEPFYVWAICSHNKDGVFRIYLEPVGRDPNSLVQLPDFGNYHPEDPALGPYIDRWLTDHPNSRIIRKKMDSPKFNKYRPFPLGMCNVGTKAMFLERQPQRRHEQGLTRNSVYSWLVSAGSRQNSPKVPSMDVDLMSLAMKSCIKNEHPSASDCLRNLLDPKIENEAVAFNRNFALVRGPIEMIFLGYKSEIIGVLPKNNFDYLRLGREFRHTKEVVEELGIFRDISWS